MILLLATLALASASDPLRAALQSPEGMAQLFTQFEAEQGRVYNNNEAKMRFRLFRKSVQEVVETNEQDLGWTAGLNFFSDLTEDEKNQYLGFNASMEHPVGEPLPASDGLESGPIDWRSKGGVTPVKNQGSCGSCWTFGAVGSVEGVHKKETGSLVTFAEQELLDCVYEGKRDGCQGGWMQDCFTYMQQKQRLAPSSAVSYRGSDGTCNYRGKANGLKAQVSGQYAVPASESGHTSGLARGPIAVAFEVTNKCQQYRGGIFKDTSCRGQANHAVTMVGYDEQKFMIKNSWGGSWGSSGYIYMARHHDNCSLYKHSAIITLSGSRPKPTDSPTDGPTDRPKPTDGPVPDCKDLAGITCQLYRDWMCQYQPHNCLKTCGRC